MRYSKPVYIENLHELRREIFKLIPRKVLTTTQFDNFSPKHFENVTGLKEIVNSIRPWDEVANIQILVTPPANTTALSIHVDGKNQKVAFNIPILNYENAYTVTYAVKDESIVAGVEYREISGLSDVPYNIPVTKYTPDQVVEVHRTYYDNHANLIDVTLPHAVVNLSNQARVVASIRWDPPLSWEDIPDN